MERIVRSGRLRPGACDLPHRATMYRDPALNSGATIQHLESSWAEWIAPFIVQPPGPAAWRALAGAWRDPRGAPDGAARGGAAMQPLPGARAALALRVPAPCRMVARHAKGDSTRMTGWMRRRPRGSRHRAVRTRLALARRLQGGDADALARMLHESQPLGADTRVRAYACGLFPMAQDDGRRVLWFDPPMRAVLPVDGVRIGREARRL